MDRTHSKYAAISSVTQSLYVSNEFLARIAEEIRKEESLCIEGIVENLQNELITLGEGFYFDAEKNFVNDKNGYFKGLSYIGKISFIRDKTHTSLSFAKLIVDKWFKS